MSGSITEWTADQEIPELRERIAELTADCKRHAGNVIETQAFAMKCPRHMRYFRGCAWKQDQRCECRAAVARHFPEYAGSA